MHEFYYKDNELKCESVSLQKAAEDFGTPLYVYSMASIIDHCRHIENTFGSIDHLSCYAVKANANLKVLEIIAREGLGADVGSGGELFLALKAGFYPEKITYSGVGKRDDEIEYSLKNDIMSFNVESEEEIVIIDKIASSLNKKGKILLRVNFDIPADTHPYITTGKKHNKFGVEKTKAAEIFLKASHLKNIEVLGIHTHIGSQITDSKTFITAARAAVDLVNVLKKKGVPISHLNFGGGFGVQYHDFVSHPDLPIDDVRPETKFTTVKLLEAALPVLQDAKCKIIIQPGRSIIAHAGVLITKVLYRKENEGRKFIIVDAGMNDLIRPSLYGSYHQISPLIIRNGQHELVDIVGPLCESGDFFAVDRMIPKVERNEYLAILCTGAYGYVLSSNYNGRPRPAEILIDGDKLSLIRKKEGYEHLL